MSAKVSCCIFASCWTCVHLVLNSADSSRLDIINIDIRRYFLTVLMPSSADRNVAGCSLFPPSPSSSYSSSDTSDVNFSATICSKVRTSHITSSLSQDTSAFSCAMLRWSQLHCHWFDLTESTFLKTVHCCYMWQSCESTMKCCPSKTFIPTNAAS